LCGSPARKLPWNNFCETPTVVSTERHIKLEKECNKATILLRVLLRGRREESGGGGDRLKPHDKRGTPGIIKTEEKNNSN